VTTNPFQLQNEREFHDRWAKTVDPASVTVDLHWRDLGSPEAAWIDRQIGDVSGKKVLDLGCGLGEAAVHFALRGATVTAADLSPEMLIITKKLAAHHGCELETVLVTADNLEPFDEDSFDVVYAANLLHHVNIEQTAQEVLRILKPGGKVAFWDPLKYNPVINVYRRMASDLRTSDEHPLSKADLEVFSKLFADAKFGFFWLSALLIFIRFWIVDRISPNADRYWKLVVERQDKHKTFLRRAHRIDSILLRWFPPVRLLCWNVAIVARKGGS